MSTNPWNISTPCALFFSCTVCTAMTFYPRPKSAKFFSYEYLDTPKGDTELVSYSESEMANAGEACVLSCYFNK